MALQLLNASRSNSLTIRPTMHLISCFFSCPSKLYLQPIPLLTRNLQMSNIGRMPGSRANVIMLQNPLGVEQMNIISTSPSQEGLDDLRNLLWPSWACDVALARLTKTKV